MYSFNECMDNETGEQGSNFNRFCLIHFILMSLEKIWIHVPPAMGSVQNWACLVVATSLGAEKLNLKPEGGLYQAIFL